MVYFKRLIQIPRLPDVRNNFENSMCMYVHVQVGDNLNKNHN